MDRLQVDQEDIIVGMIWQTPPVRGPDETDEQRRESLWLARERAHRYMDRTRHEMQPFLLAGVGVVLVAVLAITWLF